ncbi:MAG: hypothetical protein ACYDAB_15385 [bacterium]
MMNAIRKAIGFSAMAIVLAATGSPVFVEHELTRASTPVIDGHERSLASAPYVDGHDRMGRTFTEHDRNKG